MKRLFKSDDAIYETLTTPVGVKLPL